MKLAYDECSKPVCLAVELLQAVEELTFSAVGGKAAIAVANNPQTPAAHLITVALEGRLCEGLSMFLGWFVSGLRRPDCRSQEFWQLADNVVEAMKVLLMVAQGSSLLQQVQAQLIDAGEPVTACQAAEEPRNGVSVD